MNKYILCRINLKSSKTFLIKDKNGLIGWIIFRLVNGKYTRVYTGKRLTENELLKRLAR